MVKKVSTFELIMSALFVALITIGAFFKIPTALVPVSLQYTFTMLSGLLLGPKMGALSCFVYMILGLVGVPVFTSGGGLAYVLTPTFGYIVGFIAGAYLTGWIAHNGKEISFKRLLLADFAGMIITYVIGIGYFVLIMTFHLNYDVTLEFVFVNLLLMFLPADILSCIIGAMFGQKLIPQINKMKKQMG